MRSSGTTAVTTTGTNAAAAVTVLAPGSNVDRNFVNVVNTGGDGFVSVDGTNYVYMPAGTASAPSSRTFDIKGNPMYANVKAFHVSSAMSLYADAY